MKKKLPDLTWKHLQNFDYLKPIEVYDMLKLRQDIFIIEQNCIYPDIDRIDPHCEHIMLYSDTNLVAYCRLVPPGKKFDKWSIGRVTVSSKYRGNNYGRLLMNRSLDILKRKEIKTVKIEAQQYLRSFYESLGFVKISDAFDVDGIPHILMKTEFV